MSLAGLSRKLEHEVAGNPLLIANWSVIKKWKETKRYSPPGSIGKIAVERLIDAIENPQTGFLQWLLKH